MLIIYLQGFGVGALEDEDDDIYSKDHMSNYDMTMEIEDTSNLHGWTAPKHKHGMFIEIYMNFYD